MTGAAAPTGRSAAGSPTPGRRAAVRRRIRTVRRAGILFSAVGTLLAALGLAGLVLAAGPPEGWAEGAREVAGRLQAIPAEAWVERARDVAGRIHATPPEGWLERAGQVTTSFQARPPEDLSVAAPPDPGGAERGEGEDAPVASDSVPTAVPPTPIPIPTAATAPTPTPIGAGAGLGTRGDAARPSFVPVRAASTPAPTPAPTPPKPSPAAAPAASLPITGVAVPRLSLVADVLPARLLDRGGGLTWEVPAYRAGHAEATAGAGGLGNAVLLGHVASRDAGNVFKDLGKARAGDRVQVFSGERQFEYRVVEVREADRTDVSVAAPTEAPSLSLITCTGVWLPFVRDYTKRLVVRAELADAATAIAPPAPVSRAPGDAAVLRTVLEERFADNRHGWPHDPQAAAWFADGAYRLSARRPGRFVAVGAPLATPLRDVVVTGTFRKVGGPPGGGYGLIVRDRGPGPRDGIDQGGRYYVLEVGDRGELGIWRREDDHWVEILPWTPSEVVRPGGATNVLSVQATGEQLTFLVNGSPVAGAVDPVLGAGSVGIFAGGDSNEVVAERFVVQVFD